MNLGVYITLKNDDLFIADVIKPVVEVFPQVQVIDLESTDNSIAEVEKFKIPLTIVKDVGGKEFTSLKNFYGKKHDWVIWIDSDEIYPVASLLKMKELIESSSKAIINYPLKRENFIPYEHRKTIRCSWLLIREEKDQLFIANELRMNGHKAFDSKLYTFIDPWPYEVLYGNQHLKGSKKADNEVWCWHAVLLERSSTGDYGPRAEKRQAKLKEYIPKYEWIKIDKFPWK